MKSYFKYLRLLSVAIFIITLLTNCENDEVNKEEELKLKVQLATNASFGKILVNQKNQSIYFFASDVTGESNCKGGCAGVWPPVFGETYDLVLGEGLDKDDFSTFTREDGQKQLTYKGWPLYYFSPNGDGVLEATGETLGDGKNGVFHIAKPDYTVLLGKQAVEEGGDAVVYLVDDRGVSLYHSNTDGENLSNCAGGCAGIWPPYKAEENWIVPSSLSLDDFNSVDRADELGPQLSYLGSPIYHFKNDELIQGNVKGQGGAGGKFFVLNPAQ